MLFLMGLLGPDLAEGAVNPSGFRRECAADPRRAVLLNPTIFRAPPCSLSSFDPLPCPRKCRFRVFKVPCGGLFGRFDFYVRLEDGTIIVIEARAVTSSRAMLRYLGATQCKLLTGISAVLLSQCNERKHDGYRGGIAGDLSRVCDAVKFLRMRDPTIRERTPLSRPTEAASADLTGA